VSWFKETTCFGASFCPSSCASPRANRYVLSRLTITGSLLCCAIYAMTNLIPYHPQRLNGRPVVRGTKTHTDTACHTHAHRQTHAKQIRMKTSNISPQVSRVQAAATLAASSRATCNTCNTGNTVDMAPYTTPLNLHLPRALCHATRTDARYLIFFFHVSCLVFTLTRHRRRDKERLHAYILFL
jgi:hypothetical protein